MDFETLFFFLTAALAVVSAVSMITRRNPMISVLYLIVNFFCIALLYLILRAQFIAVIQILVYAGAIMVLFLFAIMLLNLRNETARATNRGLKKFVAIGLASAAFFEIILAFQIPHGIGTSGSLPQAVNLGTVEAIGRVLFTRYLVPFEITSVLLLAAIVGVIVLAKKLE